MKEREVVRRRHVWFGAGGAIAGGEDADDDAGDGGRCANADEKEGGEKGGGKSREVGGMRGEAEGEEPPLVEWEERQADRRPAGSGAGGS